MAGVTSVHLSSGHGPVVRESPAAAVRTVQLLGAAWGERCKRNASSCPERRCNGQGAAASLRPAGQELQAEASEGAGSPGVMELLPSSPGPTANAENTGLHRSVITLERGLNPLPADAEVSGKEDESRSWNQ